MLLQDAGIFVVNGIVSRHPVLRGCGVLQKGFELPFALFVLNLFLAIPGVLISILDSLLNDLCGCAHGVTVRSAQ